MDNSCIKIPTEKCLELMVQEEERIRMSKEYQEQCTKVKDIVNGWLDVSANVQKEVAKKFGFIDEVSNNIAINMLRRARYLYPDNEIFKNVPVYVRENKANQGKFNIGDQIENINLFDIQENQINFESILQPNKLNLVLVSSLT